MESQVNSILSSFRDPSGYVFKKDGVFYRLVNMSYKDNYDHLIGSGLYRALLDKGLLVSHAEVETDQEPQTYKVLLPEQMNFISYPYEWSFSQYKEAALITLEILLVALEFGMVLKDASAFNIQFIDNKPKLIDTLSFEKYEDKPWVAYKQFCQHFLAPLSIMNYCDLRLNTMMRNYIDGVPLDLVIKLLPTKARFNIGLLIHLYGHAKSVKKYENNKGNTKSFSSEFKFNNEHLNGIIESLRSTINSLTTNKQHTEWEKYYQEGENNYKQGSFISKERIIESIVKKVAPKLVWDMGGNTGHFSKIVSDLGIPVVLMDSDPVAIDIAWRKHKQTKIFPLVMDLTNPTTGFGWAGSERMSINERANADMILALALVHHLAISNNTPFIKIAEWFSSLAPWLVIEWVPKEDSNTQRLLNSREDIFNWYNREHFIQVFGLKYHMVDKYNIDNSDRTIFIFKKI